MKYFKMLVFIDDSGDPGFKLDRGSSRNFVIACVIFDDELDAEETALEIKKLRRELGKTDCFEFKFNRCSKEERIKFLERVSHRNFRYRAIVMEKEKVYGEELRRSKGSFYSYPVKMVLKHSFGSIKNARVRIDGSGEREFRRKMAAYLRKQVNEKSDIIKDIKFRDSRKDVLIQLADMVAGAVNRSFNEKPDASVYRKIIKRREDNVWPFCK